MFCSWNCAVLFAIVISRSWRWVWCALADRQRWSSFGRKAIYIRLIRVFLSLVRQIVHVGVVRDKNQSKVRFHRYQGCVRESSARGGTLKGWTPFCVKHSRKGQIRTLSIDHTIRVARLKHLDELCQFSYENIAVKCCATLSWWSLPVRRLRSCSRRSESFFEPPGRIDRRISVLDCVQNNAKPALAWIIVIIDRPLFPQAITEKRDEKKW